MINSDFIAGRPIRLGFFLTDGFSLMSYASVVEPFRAANLLFEKDIYQWRHISLDGAPARASNGASIIVDQPMAEAGAFDTLFLFAGGDPSRFHDDAAFAWLRDAARRQVTIAGISGGPYLMARAGLLDGYRATIHWEHRAALEAEFPLLEIDSGLYVIDRRRMTCAGGTAGLDLALDLIEREQGHDLAAKVGDWFIGAGSRAANAPQRLSLRDRYDVGNDRVLKVLARMEAAVEEPLTRDQLAAIAGVSLRQLERLFADQLGASVNDTYLRIRLNQANQLLRSTGMTTIAVGVACGFRSASHFSRAFKSHHGRSPSHVRRHQAG